MNALVSFMITFQMDSVFGSFTRDELRKKEGGDKDEEKEKKDNDGVRKCSGML